MVRSHEEKMRDPPPIITACSMSGFCFSQHTLTPTTPPVHMRLHAGIGLGKGKGKGKGKGGPPPPPGKGGKGKGGPGGAPPPPPPAAPPAPPVVPAEPPVVEEAELVAEDAATDVEATPLGSDGAVPVEEEGTADESEQQPTGTESDEKPDDEGDKDGGTAGGDEEEEEEEETKSAASPTAAPQPGSVLSPGQPPDGEVAMESVFPDGAGLPPMLIPAERVRAPPISWGSQPAAPPPGLTSGFGLGPGMLPPGMANLPPGMMMPPPGSFPEIPNYPSQSDDEEEEVEDEDDETESKPPSLFGDIGEGQNPSPTRDDHKVSGHNRKDLINSHLKRPRISIRKLGQYIRWLNSLHIWHTEVTIETLQHDVQNGLLLCQLMQKLVPTTQYHGLNKRPLSRKPALKNIEQALNVIWTSGRVNNTRIPSSDDLYEGKTDKIAILLQEIFEVYVMRDLRKEAPRMLAWYDGILAQYPSLRDGGKPGLSPGVKEPPHDGLWEELQSGTAMFCVVYHFNGPAWIGRGGNSVKIDTQKIHWEPKDLGQYRANVTEIFTLLKALGVGCLWNVDDWITFPDQDFVLLQLHQIFDRYRNSHCVIPPAHGPSPGIASGRDGQPIVVGLDFAKEGGNDGPGGNQPRSVLLGDGGGQSLSIPKMFDNSQANLSPGLMFFSRDATYNTAVPPPPNAPSPSPPSPSKSKRADWASAGAAGGGADTRLRTTLSRQQASSQVASPAMPLSPDQLAFRREEIKLKLEQLEQHRSVLPPRDFEVQKAQMEALLEALDKGGDDADAAAAAVASAGKRRPRASPGKPNVAQRKKREAGWVGHTGAKETANRKLLANQESGVPKKMDAAAPETMDHATAWEAFKLHLQLMQGKHLYERDVADMKHLKMLQADRAKQQATQKVPKTQLTGANVTGLALGDLQAAIRSEELRLMTIEEERRYTAMQKEREEQRSDGRVPTLGSSSDPANVDSQYPLFSARTGPTDMPAVPEPVQARDLEGTNVSLAWLSTERQMMLKERNSTRPVGVCVRPARELPVEVRGEPNQYGLVWTRQDNKGQGFVLLGNIETVTRGSVNPTQFTVGKFSSLLVR